MAKPFVYISGYHNTVTCLVFDPATGALTPSSTSDGGKNPSYLAWNPERTRMYAINEAGAGRVTAFAIKPEDGSLTRINDAAAAGGGPCHVAVHPGGRWVFSANYGSGHVGVLPVREDGGVGEPIVSELAGKNAHEAVCDPSGRFLFVPCLGSDHLAFYRFDAATGRLSANAPASLAIGKGAGPRHLVLHPQKPYAYLINELDSTVSCLSHGESGVMSTLQTVSTLPAGVAAKGNSTAHVVVSPSGDFLYGSNRGHNSIVIHRIGADGKLTLVGHETGGGDIVWPRDFTIDPSGAFMLVASQKADRVTVFRIDQQSGKLSKVGNTAVPAGPSFVGVMPRP